MLDIQPELTLSQLEVLDFMYSKHLVSPVNTMKALETAGINLSKGARVEDLFPYDQDHFGGVEATEQCLRLLSIDANSNVLDIGSGLGGPARYLAHRTGCRVTGIEIQPDRFEASRSFTQAVGLQNRVSFLNDDFISAPLQAAQYTHVVSFLSILHMIDKKKAILRLGNLVRKPGKVFIEDYYRKAEVSAGDETVLLETISCPNLMGVNEYVETLEQDGIKVVQLADTTDQWRRIVEERAKVYNEDLVGLSKRFGLDAALNAVGFAEGVLRIFHSGLIGGVRIIGESA